VVAYALAQAVKSRRRQSGLSQPDLWRRGGSSDSTLTGIEKCLQAGVLPSTLRKLDAGLDWAAGTALKVLSARASGAPHPRGFRFDRNSQGPTRRQATSIDVGGS
jgi:hypothetical protein